jgi:ribosomal subunit interface protein
MASPRITFRDVERSPALETQIRERAQKLERFSHRMTCHVVVAVPHRHRKRGYLFSVRIEAAIPGGEIVVEPHQREGYADAHVAVRDAFDALTRRLEDHERRVREEMKTRAAQT